jgi:thiopeptide-type bacteriocin biosynthesis protein
MLRALDFFVARIPSLPKIVGDQILGSDNSDELIQWLDDPIFLESIYIASPALYSEVLKVKTNTTKTAKKIRKLKKTIYKYVTRMSSRATPFGLFASCALGELGDVNKVIVNSKVKPVCKRRLDVNVILLLCEKITGTREIKGRCTFFTNNTFYIVNNTYRYINYHIAGQERAYQLQEIEPFELLEKIVQDAKLGTDYNGIVGVIMNAGYSVSEAENFIDELIDEQILVSNIYPPLNIDNQLDYLLRVLKSVDVDDFFVSKISAIHMLLQNRNLELSGYERIRDVLGSMISIDTMSVILHVDSFFSTNIIQLKKDWISSVLKNLSTLFLLSEQSSNSDLSDFITNFKKRFDQEIIPLSKALDPEYGIGYASKAGSKADRHLLLQGIKKPLSHVESIPMNHLVKLNFKLYHRYLQQPSNVVYIETVDFEELGDSNRKIVLPSHISVLGSVINPDSSDEPCFELISSTGPGISNLLGRFSSGDVNLSSKIRSYSSQEISNASVIFAEILHLPNGKAGNIISKPKHREYELPLVAMGTSDLKYQLPLDDIWIRIVNDEIVLISKSLKCRIIPRLDNAYNYVHGNLPHFKFLCDLQLHHHTIPFNWNWGPFEDKIFLPRVIYKNIIVSRSRWRIQESDVGEVNLSDLEQRGKFFKKFQLPKKFAIKEGDNELLVSFDNTTSIDIFVKELKSKKSLMLVEFIDVSESAFVENSISGEPYTNEIVLPLSVDKEFSKDYSYTPVNLNPMTVQRRFPPGSEWLYYKLYCSTKKADAILQSVHRMLLEQGSEFYASNPFFFIRYTDPDHHLRIRIQVKDTLIRSKVIEILNQHFSMLMDLEDIITYSIDSYEREVERYGYKNIVAAEFLFHEDSKLVISIIEQLEGYENDDYVRWLLALKTSETYLKLFDLSYEEQIEFMKYIFEGFYTEFGASKDLLRILNRKYNGFKRHIEKFLDNNNNRYETLLSQVDHALLNFRNSVQSYFKTTKNKREQIYYLDSFLHMHINRLFVSNQRKYELVVYYLLLKRLMSLSKRNNFKPR